MPKLPLPARLPALLLSATATLVTSAAIPQPALAQHWVQTWAAPPSSPANNPFAAAYAQNSFTNQTLRLIVHTSVGGNSARVRVSNVFGVQALNVGAAHIAVRDGSAGANVLANTDHVLTFSGSSTVSIAPGVVAVSDPVSLPVPQLGDLAVSLYLPDNVTPDATVQPLSHQTSYISDANTGDQTAVTTFPTDSPRQSWPFLMGVEVLAPASVPAFVCFGDSITEGLNSTADTNHRWPDFFKARLFAQNRPAGVVDQGISSNQLLVDRYAPSGLARFDRDVLAQPALTHATVLLGINDINMSSSTADALIAGHRQLIARAHDRGVKIIGCTLTPAGETAGSAQETARLGLNRFLRTSGEYDGLIDFEAATVDPANPTTFLAQYDSGDHLHPNDAGYQAMGNAVDLTLFNGSVTLNSVVSRKTHGSAGVFDLPLPQGPCATPAIECRGGGASGAYTLVFGFTSPISSILGAAVAEGVGSATSLQVDANDARQVTVNLTGVTSGQYVTLALTNVTDALGNTSSVRATMGVLVGDVGNNATVNAADIAQTRSLSGQGVNAQNFRADINLDGVINAADIAFVKSRSGTGLPAAPSNVNP